MSSKKKVQKKTVVYQPLFVKVNAINELEQGIIATKAIAENLNVHPRTVQRWQSEKRKILEDVNNNFDGVIPKKIKRIRKAKYEEVDKATWMWFRERRSSGIPLSGVAIRTQAQLFHKALGGSDDEFSASAGWLDKFKNRHGMRYIASCGEKKSADVDSAQSFKVWLSDFIEKEGLLPEQIFNCAETGLNYRTLPSRTYAIKEKDAAAGFKQKGERITVMACSNASGNCKLPLVVIGKSKKPRCIQSVSNLPVYYTHQASTWMSSDLFAEWFNKEFVPKVTLWLQSKQLPVKAVLFVDNCSAHPDNVEANESIFIKFLPPNTTPILQPMDQGILHCLKLKYRLLMMFNITDNFDAGNGFIDIIKNININHAIEWIAKAWERIPPSTLKKSWIPVWPQHPGVDQNIDHSQQPLWDQPANHVGQSTSADVIPESSTNLNSDLMNTSVSMEELLIPNRIEKFCEMLQKEPSYDGINAEKIDQWLNPPQLMTDDEFLCNEEIVEVIIHERELPEKKVENETLESKNISLHLEAKDAKTNISKLINFFKKYSDHFNKAEVDQLENVSLKINYLLLESEKNLDLSASDS